MDRCQICGRHPAKWMSFKAHQGFVVVRREIEFCGTFCRDHAMEAYMAARGATLKGMWFSASSLLFGAARSLWDSMKLLDLPDEVKDEPWVPHVVACPYCGQKNVAPAGSGACHNCSKVFVVASCASCNAVHVFRRVQSPGDITFVCRICGTRTAGPEAIRNWPAMLLMRGIAEASAVVASSSGAGGDAERETFRAAIRQFFQPDASTIQYLDRYFDKCVAGGGVDLLRTFKEFCAPEYRRLVLAVSLLVARTDGVVNESERRVLRCLAERLGFDPNVAYEGVDAEPAGTGVAEPWWEIFKVSQEASLDEVSFAYRKLAMQFHPDIWAQAPEGQRTMADARMKSINAAFERAKHDIYLREQRRAAAAASAEKAASEHSAEKEADEQRQATVTPTSPKRGSPGPTAATPASGQPVDEHKADVSDGAPAGPRAAPSSPSRKPRPKSQSRSSQPISVARRTGRFLRRHAVAITAAFVGLALLGVVSLVGSGFRREDPPTYQRVALVPPNPLPAPVASSGDNGSSRQSLQKEIPQRAPMPGFLEDDKGKAPSLSQHVPLPPHPSQPMATNNAARAFSAPEDARRRAAHRYIEQGIANAKTGHLEQAILDLTEAIKIDARYAKAYFNRGVVWIMLGEYDIAIHDFDRTIQLDPKYPLVFEHRDLAVERKRGSNGGRYIPSPPTLRERVSVREAVDRDTAIRSAEEYYRKRAAAKQSRSTTTP